MNKMLVGQDMTELAEYKAALESKVERKTHELKRALQKEQEVIEMKSRFVYIASHEFRSPLSAIEFQTNSIRQSSPNFRGNDLGRRLDAIDEQVRRMKLLMEDVLTYAKGEGAMIQLDVSEIVLSDFLSKIIEEVSHYTKNKTHNINTEFSFLPVSIRSDERLLRSILINLLTNAIKFSPEKECINLSVNCSLSHQLIISVRDNGIGIAEDEINKIFEPFHRSKSVSSIQGSGLGLSIVKKSIELLNGKIQAQSQLGKGTTFTVVIPLGQAVKPASLFSL